MTMGAITLDFGLLLDLCCTRLLAVGMGVRPGIVMASSWECLASALKGYLVSTDTFFSVSIGGLFIIIGA